MESSASAARLSIVRKISDTVIAWGRDMPDQPAITEDGVTWNYAQLAAAIRDTVVLLRETGIRRGDRVMLIGENGIMLATLILAVSELGGWAVLENARRAAREVDAIRDHCQARRVFYAVSNSPDAAAHAARHGAEHMATSAGDIAVGALDDSSEPVLAASEGDCQIAVLIYTTGTTGVPKGVMLSHGNLLYLASMMVQLRKLTTQDKVYAVLPITHVMGLAPVFCGALYAGAHLYIVSRFSAENCLHALAKDGITVMQGAPAMFAKLFHHARGKSVDAPTLRFIAAGGAPIDLTAKNELEALFGLTLHNGYGLTEASGLCWTRLEHPRKDSSVGLPLPGVELRLLDAKGVDVSPNEVGELWARGPNVMQGYYRNPKLTAEATLPGGWFNTQDLARITEDGHVFIEGRTKDLIITSGFNVYPLEVENALNAHPHIVHSAVVGRSRNGDEDVIAFVELANGKSLALKEVQDFLAERISPYKRPREIFILQMLPTSPNGKVLKHSLKAFAASGDAGGLVGNICLLH